MKGDIIIVEPHHQAAAAAILDRYETLINSSRDPFVFTVAGESGSGKSETGKAIADECASRGLNPFVFQQDDYFSLPPRSNDRKRREDISWVGTGEVRLDLLNAHLVAARKRPAALEKPLVDYEADAVLSETVDLSRVDVVVAEGTYTTLLDEVDCRVFIARNRLETLDSRKTRAREAIEPFIEHVLEIEHEIIAPHREFADVVITRDYEVQFVGD
ncbi:MAG: zeta toxin family protein [Spirochaetota bacterium]